MSSDDFGSYHWQTLLTNLATRVGQMEGQLKAFMENWARQDQLAHQSRQTLYERVELIGRQVERVATDVASVQQDVAELKKEIEEDITPTIEAVENRKQRNIGAKGVWAMIGAALLAAASAMAYVADKIASFFIPKP